MAKKTSEKTPKTSGKSNGSKRGGSRVGAGRKVSEVTKVKVEIGPAPGRPTIEVSKFKAEKNAEALETIGAWIPDCLKNLKILADGGYPRVKEQWKPAAMAMVDVPATNESGNPVYGVNGAPVMTKVKAFPDLPPTQMVRVGCDIETADPDRAANEYLVNRVLGRPMQAVEVTGDNLAPIPITIEARIEQLWGEKPPEGGGGPE